MDDGWDGGSFSDFDHMYLILDFLRDVANEMKKRVTIIPFSIVCRSFPDSYHLDDCRFAKGSARSFRPAMANLVRELNNLEAEIEHSVKDLLRSCIDSPVV